MNPAVRALGLPIDMDPGQALLVEIPWTAGHVAWLRDRLRELEANDLVWGRTQIDTGRPPPRAHRHGHGHGDGRPEHLVPSGTSESGSTSPRCAPSR